MLDGLAWRKNMWTRYSLKKMKSDPVVTFHLPDEIIKDIESRAKIFGRSFDMEFKLRLMRSLEKDNAMDESDNLLEAIFYSEENAYFNESL